MKKLTGSNAILVVVRGVKSRITKEMETERKRGNRLSFKCVNESIDPFIFLGDPWGDGKRQERSKYFNSGKWHVQICSQDRGTPVHRTNYFNGSRKLQFILHYANWSTNIIIIISVPITSELSDLTKRRCSLWRALTLWCPSSVHMPTSPRTPHMPLPKLPIDFNTTFFENSSTATRESSSETFGERVIRS